MENMNSFQTLSAVRLKRRSENLKSLSEASDECLTRYFNELGGMTPPPELYAKIMSQVEKPLIEHVLRYVRGNQVRAAAVLGINRNTLRKKILALDISIEEITGRRLSS